MSPLRIDAPVGILVAASGSWGSGPHRGCGVGTLLLGGMTRADLARPVGERVPRTPRPRGLGMRVARWVPVPPPPPPYAAPAAVVEPELVLEPAAR